MLETLQQCELEEVKGGHSGGASHSLSVDHAVWVQHGYDLEDVGLPQARC